MLQDDIQEAVWRTILRGPRPPSHRWPPVQKSQHKSNQPRRNELAARAGQQPVQPHRRDSPQSARNVATVPNMTPKAITEDAAVEVRRLEEAVGALGEESPHAKLLLRQRPNSTTPSVSRSNQRHSTWNEPGRGWCRPKQRSPESQHRKTNVLQMRQQPNGGSNGCKIPRCNKARGVRSVAKSNRRVDSRTGFSASFCESRPRRGCSIFFGGGEHVESKCGQFGARA